MNIPKDQHYIPRMLLKRFTDKEGNLSFYDKRHPDKGVRKRTPKNLFYERHLYTQVEEDGTQDASVETEFLAVLESKVAPIIAMIVKAARLRRVPVLEACERKAYVEYFRTQLVRLPERRRWFAEETRRQMIQEIENASAVRLLKDHELALLNGDEEIERMWNNSSIATLPQAFARDPMSERYARGGLCVAVIRKPTSKRAFVIGSNPIVRLVDDDRIYYENPDIELWLPLARDVAVALNPGTCDRLKVMKDKHIWKTNEIIFNQSAIVAGCSCELIESLRQGSI